MKTLAVALLCALLLACSATKQIKMSDTYTVIVPANVPDITECIGTVAPLYLGETVWLVGWHSSQEDFDIFVLFTVFIDGEARSTHMTFIALEDKLGKSYYIDEGLFVAGKPTGNLTPCSSMPDLEAYFNLLTKNVKL